MSFRRPAYWRTDRFGDKHEPRIEWREVEYFDKYDDEFVGYEGVIKVGNTTKPERFWITSLPNGKYTMQFFEDRPATPLPGRKDGWNLGAREYFGLSQAKDSALAFIDAFDRGKDRRGIQRFKKNPDKDELIKAYRYWLDVFQYASTDDEYEKAQDQIAYMERKYPHLREEFDKLDPQSWDTLENPKKDRMYLFHIAHRGTAYFGLGPNPRIAKRKLTQQLKGTGLTADSPNVLGYDIDYNSISGEGWNSKI